MFLCIYKSSGFAFNNSFTARGCYVINLSSFILSKHQSWKCKMTWLFWSLIMYITIFIKWKKMSYFFSAFFIPEMYASLEIIHHTCIRFFFQFSNIMKYVWICIKDCNMLSNFSWIYWNWNFNLFVIWYVCVYQLPIKDNIPVFNLFPLRKISYIFILHSTGFFLQFWNNDKL